METVQPPAERKHFRVAIICALPREFNAVALLFDQFWDENGDRYGKADKDLNYYITGRIGEHNVVLATLPKMGNTSAAGVTASLRMSYTGLRFGILVGICGGVPQIDGCDAFLGDVVISKSIVQYDYGKKYPGHFAVTNTVEDTLGSANSDLRSLLTVLETDLMRDRLQDEASRHLKGLQEAAKKKRRGAKYPYPGAEQDKLFPPTYSHRHHGWCSVCSDDPGIFCEAASKASCAAVKCDEGNLVVRERPASSGETFTPEIFFGRIGSGNTVMKSGEDRDRIASAHDLIAFEMEGAGSCHQLQCIVVKGICDYADSHKNDTWQDFAAATAASVMKAIVERYKLQDEDRGPTLTKDQRSLTARSVESNSFEGQVWINQGDVGGNVTFM
ncbi:nucleoside phosphorylase domain-containing protein [Fusarium flagelliforme]|uniref:nucleoside phosphorylase domain-containing protein n=1 Tax=Fusarium flagelliforme TaxID=2675880 RepID=UPI001E8E616A|nr:nucleoside phosphorylase domain-containing protein [Fusarium flagelliforme]KAH7182440.1 nucleoside phosphorylase domain-containing protein [Fusarium flagelliforme]